MILFLSRGLELYLLCNRFSKVSADEEKFTLSSKLIFLNHILSLFYFKSSNRLPLHSEYSPYSLDGPSHFSNFISQFLYISPWKPYSPKCSSLACLRETSQPHHRRRFYVRLSSRICPVLLDTRRCSRWSALTHINSSKSSLL